MLALRPAALLLSALLSTLPAPAQPPLEPWEPGVRHLELPATTATAVAPELRLTPGLALTLLFDTPLRPLRQGGVGLEERERFPVVSLDEEGRVLTLVLSREAKPGKRRLRVHFADGGGPASAEFVLVAHPAPAETHVQVYRQPRSAEVCCQEAEAQREKARQCQEELTRTRAEAKEAGRGGLIGLRAGGLMDEDGVRGQSLDNSRLTLDPRRALELRDAISFQAAVLGGDGAEKRVRVAVLLRLASLDGQDWKVEGAQLAARGGARPNVTVWQSAPLEPGRWNVMVEAEVPEEEARDRFTLKLWDASGSRTFSVSGVTFP